MQHKDSDDERVDMSAVLDAMRDVGHSFVRKDTIEEGSPEFGQKVLEMMAFAKHEAYQLLGHVPTSIEERAYFAPAARAIVHQRWVLGDKDMILAPPTELLIRYFRDAYGFEYEKLVSWTKMDEKEEVTRILASGESRMQKLLRKSPIQNEWQLDSDYPLPTRVYLAREQERMHRP